MEDFWKNRGAPWEYDPGPPKNRRWAELFASTPNYRGLGLAALGRENFRWHFGPMFYRGRLSDHAVKVLVIGQEGAQDESLARRSFTGGTGSRMQHFLHYLGITQSYLFLNTFVYPIFGQYEDSLRWLAQNPASPIVRHRHEIFNYVLERNEVHLIIAVGKAAKESVVTWVQSRGGNCPQGAQDISQCTGGNFGPRTHLVGVLHPGGAGKGSPVSAIIASFKAAAAAAQGWMAADPAWLPPDPSGQRQLDQPFKYKSAPIPFRDFPYGIPWPLGSGATTSNRKDQQRTIQLFSAGGKYNNLGASLSYTDGAAGSAEGYSEPAGDLPYEPPRTDFLEYDEGPGEAFARLALGGVPGLEWPDFAALGVTAHPSLGRSPLYRGRPVGASILILADQQSHDDLFTGRALSGDSGQHLQAFLESIGIRRSYVILRVLPVDTLDLPAGMVRSMVDHPKVRQIYQAILNEVRAASPNLGLALTVGPQSTALAQNLVWNGLPRFALKAWKENGSLTDWQNQIAAIRVVDYLREIAQPTFAYDGRRGQIPRFDLPFGMLRWWGTSGDRARRAVDGGTHQPSPHYYKYCMPDWAFRLKARPLSAAEQAAMDSMPH